MSSETMENNKNSQSQPRLCHVIKRDDFDGYGFNLHAEKGKPGQYIGKVDEKSPAETSGLKEGDRIISVNDVNIGSETHKQVVQRIKAISGEVRLLVVDPDVEVTKDNQIIQQNNNKKIETEPIENNIVPIVSSPSPSPSDDTDSPSKKTTIEMESEIKETTIFAPLPIEVKSENGKLLESNGSSNGTTTITTTTTTTTTKNSTGLNFNMTAAEMRAKLANKKKHDPKFDSVDLRRKHEIIQKM